MTPSEQIIRLFISSTFSDFAIERSLLHQRIFPAIRTFCRRPGVRFQPIDLRWGVSQELVLDSRSWPLPSQDVSGRDAARKWYKRATVAALLAHTSPGLARAMPELPGSLLSQDGAIPDAVPESRGLADTTPPPPHTCPAVDRGWPARSADKLHPDA